MKINFDSSQDFDKIKNYLLLIKAIFMFSQDEFH